MGTFRYILLAGLVIAIGVWWTPDKRSSNPRSILEKYLPATKGQSVEIVSMKTLKGGWDVEYQFHLKHTTGVFASIFSAFQKEDDAGANWVKDEFDGKIESFEKGQPMEVYRHDIGSVNLYVVSSKEHTESWLQIGMD